MTFKELQHGFRRAAGDRVSSVRFRPREDRQAEGIHDPDQGSPQQTQR